MAQRESNPGATPFMQHLLRCRPRSLLEGQVEETVQARVIVTTLSDRYEERLLFGEQDPFRGRALGQGKQLWVREGFTEELAA